MLPAIVLLLASAQAPWPAAHLPKVPPIDQTLATVNGKAITAGELAPYLWDWRATEVAQDLIAYRVVADEAAKKGVAATPEETEKALQNQLSQMVGQLPPGQELDATLRERGIPRSRLYLRTLTDLLLTRLAQAEFQPDQFVKTSTFAVKPKSDAAEDVAEAIRKAQDAHARLVKGEDWPVVLRSVTEDAAVLQNDGRLDWVSIEAFPTAAREEIGKLAPGGYTKPVQTVNGIQVFRIDRQGKEATGAELEDLRARALVKLRPQLFDRLQREAKIERFLGADK